MSSTENQLFDAAFPIKIGNQEFQASMLTDRDYGDLDLYIKSRYIELSMKQAGTLSDELRKEILSVANRDAMKIGWSSDEGIEIIWADDGLLHLGYHMVRKRHGNKVTFSKFEALARGKKDEKGQWSSLRDSIEQILIAWSHFNPTEEDIGGSSTGSEKSEEQGSIASE